MSWVLTYQRQIAVVAAFGGSVFGAVRYFNEQVKDREQRQQELRWQRSQFVLNLADTFEQDPRFQRALKMLAFGTELPAKSSLHRILAQETSDLSADELDALYALDRYLDFFDRLAYYVGQTEVLQVSDASVFADPLDQIVYDPDLHSYACREGYTEGVKLAEDMVGGPHGTCGK
jgi:hypothetical protein